MVEVIQWIATAATITAATVTAANLGSRITGYGFGIFLVGSLAWLATGIMTGQSALTWTNAVLTVLNVFGMWRWLGRQAKVEQGASSAAADSAKSAGETLFPVSLLTRARLSLNGVDSGQCIDAMAGTQSGRLRYIVFSSGGVAGVGETLRRLDWREVEASKGGLSARVSGGAESLPEVERDDWPAR